MIKKITSTLLCLGTLVYADSGSSSQLAHKLTNPVANMTSLPFQYNYASGVGGHNSDQTIINFQPVIPIHINSEWNLITRIVMPIVKQSNVTAVGENQTFIGDTLFSLFMSPVKPVDGWIIGVGPAINAPTSTNIQAAPAEWSVGPTAVLLHMKDGLTYGLLANALFSVSNADNSDVVRNTFIQPFISYTTSNSVTYALNSETTYDLASSKSDIPFNLTVAKLVKFGKLPVSLGAGIKYWAKSDISKADNFGVRATVTFILPN
ncbi:MAG: transporter [Helicobacteraceae bacterium]|nr:transporter [Helicobacteraceae bacterium]